MSNYKNEIKFHILHEKYASFVYYACYVKICYIYVLTYIYYIFHILRFIIQIICIFDISSLYVTYKYP